MGRSPHRDVTKLGAGALPLADTDENGVMAPRPLPADEYWSMASSVRSMDRGHPPEPYEELLLREAVELAGGPAVVETVHVLGVGTGRELPAVRRAAPGARLLAWDIAPAMVAACRHNLDGTALADIAVGVSAAGDLTPAHGRAQLVVACNAVLGYVVPATERRRTLAALADVLVPGGVLMGVVQQRRCLPDWAAWFAAHDALAAARLVGSDTGDRWIGEGGATVAHHHFTRRELVALLAGADLHPEVLTSLRRYLGPYGRRPPGRSPNPLVTLAVRRSA